MGDTKNEMSEFLESRARFVSKGFFYGKLFKISWYPGAITSSNKSHKVFGTLFEISDSHTVFSVLDDYEGASIKHGQPSLFKRKRITAYIDKGITVKTWVYLYNRPVEGLSRISSGDFLN